MAADAPDVCSVVACLTGSPDDLRSLPDAVTGIQVRADLVGDLDPTVLKGRTSAELCYSLRSAAAGGAYTGDTAQRHRRLLRAAREYDLVELEADRDLTPWLLNAIPPLRRQILWRGESGREGIGARLHVVETEDATRLRGEFGRDDVTAYATGAAGTWSRLVAPRLGAPIAFCRLGDAGPDGMPSLSQLLDDYLFPQLRPIETLFGIVGTDVSRSLSPRLHNAAYRELGLPAFFVPVTAQRFEPFFTSMMDVLAGLTVVSPHKAAALRMADSVSADATRADGANLLVRGPRGWRAYCTDPVGVLQPLRRRGISLAGRRAAVVGCGGAGRGAAVGLLRAGLTPTMVNRGLRRGAGAAGRLGLDFVPLKRFDAKEYDLVVHATPLREEPPFAVAAMRPGAVVVDLAYGRQETALAAACRRRGLTVVDGWDVLVVEVARQFRLMTGRRMPPVDSAGLRTGRREE
jgi:3-dehydroquinate dehydratase/shikimate dehydrogenase